MCAEVAKALGRVALGCTSCRPSRTTQAGGAVSGEKGGAAALKLALLFDAHWEIVRAWGIVCIAAGA